MKKTLRLIGLMLVSVVLCAGFSACGDDDNDEPAGPVSHDAALLGTWVMIEVDPDGERDEWTFTFNADGTYRTTEIEYYPSGSQQTEWISGTWSTNEARNRIYITVLDSYNKEDIGETDSYSYSVSGNTLILDGDVFNRQ